MSSSSSPAWTLPLGGQANRTYVRLQERGDSHSAVDFTPMSSEMTPSELVGLLNELFSAFDDLAAELGVEKIKTAGDEHMVASGVPEPRSDHAHAAARLALRMRDHVASHEIAGQHIQMRIGIHSGPLVAGVIGKGRFSYDLCGVTR